MMSTTFTPPPPFAVTDGGSAAVGDTSPQRSSASSSSIVVVIIIIASAIIVSASIYLLLRWRSRRSSAAAGGGVASSSQNQQQKRRDDLLDSLPLFTFRSVTPASAAAASGGDCAVCLSRFEPHDRLRLLPLCCHAFHAACIDAWIVSNQTCPLCRSTVLPSALDKILSPENRAKISGASDGGSFRVEIGSISRRRDGAEAAPDTAAARRRSYSVGSFEYIVDGNGLYEVPVEFTAHSRRFSDLDSGDKEFSLTIPAPEIPAEVSGGRSRLREYVDRLSAISISSRTMSFGSSGRFFSGSTSSRRSDAAAASGVEDLETYRAGEEISELFRWLSGV